jgi:hypothetical protein
MYSEEKGTKFLFPILGERLSGEYGNKEKNLFSFVLKHDTQFLIVVDR